MTKKIKEKKETTENIQVKELTETLQRVQAEFENFKKRTEKEATEFKEYAETDLIKSLLSVLDNFELALNNHKSPREFLKGVELIYAQLFQSLEERGLTVIEAKGKQFNPYEHEALLTEASEEKENTVLEELQKGYRFKDKIIRHTKVKIAKQSKEVLENGKNNRN
ncbi:MAG: nucleotide exchange factor GrpE [archaeon]